MFGRTSYPGEKGERGEIRDERGDTRRRASTTQPVALPGFLKRSSGHRLQQQLQNGSENLPGMDARPSALRKALHGGHHSGMDRLRRSSEANASISGARPQQRRGSPAEESRKLGSMPATTATHSWEFHEPAQPRGSSPVSRPPSVRQRQGGLSAFPPKGRSGSSSGSASYEAGRFEPAASSAAESSATGSLGTPRGSAPGQGHRKGAADRGMVGGSRADRRGEVAPTRSFMRVGGAGSGKAATDGRYSRRATAAAEGSSSILRRGSTSSNQAEDHMPSDATPRRLSSSSARAVSCPSGSQYLEPGTQHGDAVVPHGRHGSRGGQTNRRGDHEDENEDNSSRRSSGSRIGGGGGGGGGHRDGYRHHDGGRSGGAGLGARGSVRASPSTAPSTSASTEGERCLPSIDGLEISNNPAEDKPEGGRREGGGGSGGRGDPGSTPSSARHGRDLDLPGGSSHSGGAQAEGRSKIGEGLLPGKETGGQLSNNRNDDDDDRDNTGSHRSGRDINSDRDEPGDKEHAYIGASRSSGGSRVDPSGHHVSGGRVTPGGNGNNSGGDVATSRRRAGGSLQSDSEAAGRAARNSSSNSNSRSGNRECLVGLQNLGNTCFMNACLQCLLHTDALVDLFRGRYGHREQRLGSHSSASPTHGALAQAFGELVAIVEASPAHSNVSPAQVKRLIGKYAPHLAGYGQQDCQEFLRFFLDGMAEDLNTRGGGSGGGQNHHGHQRGAKTSPQQQPHIEGGAGASGRHRQQQQRSGPPPPPPAVNQELTDEQISRLTAEQQADRAWAQHRARNDSDITGMFCGQLQSRISCLTCGNVSFCFDPFFDLSVPLPSGSGRAGAAGGWGGDEGGGYGGRNSRGSHSSGGRGGESSSAFGGTSAATTTLEGCLRAFSTEETLDGDNRPVCTRCRKRRSSSKGLAVHRFPPILVIHLKRFQYSSTSRTKLATAVDFPIGSELDLVPYSTPAAHPSSSGSSGGGGKNSSLTRSTSRGSTGGGGGGNGGQRPPLYELYAVCNHMGGLHGGHYTAHCRSRSGDSGNSGVTTGEWHTFDDTRVSPVSTSRVGGAAAYVLFYRLLESAHAR
ncbi:unnamed protein product [Ectocarpus sp. 6 AP-2014]